LKKFFFLALPLLFSFAVCGNRGDPLPPFSKTPSTPSNASVIQVFNSPIVFWDEVKTFDDGRKIPEPGKVLYEVKVGKEKFLVRSNFFEDKEIHEGERRCYMVRAVYRNKKSAWTDPVCFEGKEPLKEVPVVYGKSGNKFNEFYFPEVPYEIEVFKNQSKPFIKPYKVVKTHHWIDKDVKNGVVYSYCFRYSNGMVKGKCSELLKLKPEDIYPPELPKDIRIFELGKKCLVVFEPSGSKDLKHYEVFVEGKKKIVPPESIYFEIPECPERFKICTVDYDNNIRCREVKR